MVKTFAHKYGMLIDEETGDPVKGYRHFVEYSDYAALKAENERLAYTLARREEDWQSERLRAEAAERALAERAGGVKVKPLEWKPTKTLNRNDYHGSKPYVVEYISAGEFRYTLSANYQVGASWDARRGATTPISGGTCVSLDEAKAAAQADFERRILSALESAAPERTCATCHAVLADGLQPFATYDPAAPEERQEAVAWFDMADAPKDGSMLRLLVVPDPEAWTPFDDSHNPYETIGFNNLADTEDDRWEFVGWNWSQDCFVTGQGEVIGWLPFNTCPAEQAVTDEMVSAACDAFLRANTAVRTVGFREMRAALTAAIAQEKGRCA